MELSPIPPCILVIFGGTGDLTHRKILPALYNLAHQKLLPSRFAVVAVGRREKTLAEYANEAGVSIEKHARFPMDATLYRDFRQTLFYHTVHFDQDNGYSDLSRLLATLDQDLNIGGNRLFYLAVGPEFFEPIVANLRRHGFLAPHDKAWQRLIIEKPFGNSLLSARRLNQTITEAFAEQSIFRIDHYLGKEMVQSIIDIRFANELFEPLWNHHYIDNIQISACETLGVENRSAYYDKVGALGDMIQNHLLQILALIAMEPPVLVEPESIRDEKVKLLRSLARFNSTMIPPNPVFGQYGPGLIGGKHVVGYRQENKVAADSTTDTYAALRIQINNPRWANVPFYLRSGKRLARKTTAIVVQFKPAVVFPQPKQPLAPNLLTIRIQPREELLLQFNTKQPGIQGEIIPVQMSFCQKCRNCETYANSPEAYEKLLFDALRGDSTLFTRWDEVEKSWEIVEAIGEHRERSQPLFPNYAAGAWGPAAADQLLAGDERQWWNR